MKTDLQLIAEDRIDTPLSEWPQHIKGHSITLLGNRLPDHTCLRCIMESTLAERLREKEVSEVK